MEKLGLLALLGAIFFIFILSPAVFITAILINFKMTKKVKIGAGILDLIWGGMAALFLILYFQANRGDYNLTFMIMSAILTLLALLAGLANLLLEKGVVTSILNALFPIMAVVNLLFLVFFFKVI